MAPACADGKTNLGPAEIPAKRRYTFQDAQRWALYLGFEFKSPPAHPFSPLKPLRITSAIDDDPVREALAVKLLDAAWSEGRDITSDAVVQEVANSIGLKRLRRHEVHAFHDGGTAGQGRPR